MSTDAFTRTARFISPSARTFFSDMITAAAEPSTFTEHISLVFGYAIISAPITVSSGVSIWYIAFGFSVEWWWFFTDTFANCSNVVPYLRACSCPASANTAGIVIEPSRPSFGIPPPPPAAAEQAAAHLLDADREHGVVDAGLDRHPALAERRRAGGAGVRAVHDGNAGLADLLQHALPDHRVGLAEVAAVERLHVLDLEAAVVERHQRRLRAERLDGRAGARLHELDHVDSDDVHVAHADLLVDGCWFAQA